MADQPTEFDMVATEPDDTAVVLYTSGTTGFPKGAELSHSNMTMNAIMARELFQLTHDDVHALTLPLFHSFGQTCQMNAGFSMGNTLVFIPRFTLQAVLGAMEKESVTVFAGVPTMYWAILNYSDAENQFDLEKIPILEGYGLSETCPVATFNLFQKERKPGSVGQAIWGTEVQDHNTFFNIASPLHPQHNLSAGGSYKLTEKITLDLAYTYTFTHTQSGPFYNPAGAVPGTSVETELGINVISFGVTLVF